MEEKEQHIGPQLPKNIHEAVARVSACLRHANIEFGNMMQFLEEQGYYSRPAQPAPPPVLDTAALDAQLGIGEKIAALPKIHSIQCPVSCTITINGLPVGVNKDDLIYGYPDGSVRVKRAQDVNEKELEVVGGFDANDIENTAMLDIVEQLKKAYLETGGEIPATWPKDDDAVQLANLVQETSERAEQTAVQAYNEAAETLANYVVKTGEVIAIPADVSLDIGIETIKLQKGDDILVGAGGLAVVWRDKKPYTEGFVNVVGVIDQLKKLYTEVSKAGSMVQEWVEGADNRRALGDNVKPIREGYGRRTLEAIHGVQKAMEEVQAITAAPEKQIDVQTAVRMKDGLPDGTETIVRMGNHEWGISTTLDRKPSGPVPEVVAEVAAAGGIDQLRSTINDVDVSFAAEVTNSNEGLTQAVEDVLNPAAADLREAHDGAAAEAVPAPKGAFQRMMDNFFAEHQIGLFEKFFTDRVVAGGVGNIGMEPKPETWYLTSYGEDILRTGPVRTVSWPPGIYRDYKTKENQLFLRTTNFSFVVTGLPTKPDAILYSLIRNGSASDFAHINEAPEGESEMAFIELLATVSELHWACGPSQKTE